jgi:hypothetical protein
MYRPDRVIRARFLAKVGKVRSACNAGKRPDRIRTEDIQRALIAKRLSTSQAGRKTSPGVDRGEPRIEASRSSRDQAPIFKTIEQAFDPVRLRRLQSRLSIRLLLTNHLRSCLLRNGWITGSEMPTDHDDRHEYAEVMTPLWPGYIFRPFVRIEHESSSSVGRDLIGKSRSD